MWTMLELIQVLAQFFVRPFKGETRKKDRKNTKKHTPLPKNSLNFPKIHWKKMKLSWKNNFVCKNRHYEVSVACHRVSHRLVYSLIVDACWGINQSTASSSLRSDWCLLILYQSHNTSMGHSLPRGRLVIQTN